jgi:hypothetical protein
LAAVVLAASLAVEQPSPVTATNFGSTCCVGAFSNGVWLTPETTWQVNRDSLTTTYYNGVTNAITSQYSPTDLSVFLYTSINCADVDYDLCVFDFDYGDNGMNGWNSCVGVTTGSDPNKTCSLDWVRINQFFSPPAQRIACHEMGHAVGLRHTSDQGSCMKRTVDGGDSEVLTSHDKGHLNAHY